MFYLFNIGNDPLPFSVIDIELGGKFSASLDVATLAVARLLPVLHSSR